MDDSFFDGVYEGLPLETRHNIILSLEDGYLAYYITVGDVKGTDDPTEGTWGHSYIFEKKLRNRRISCRENDKYYHIYMFLGTLRDSIEAIEKIEFPFVRYLGIINDEFENRLKTWESCATNQSGGKMCEE